MPVTDLHRRVAVIALRAASGHGFALAGGNALLAHGMISRPTQDVDLFTDDQHGVENAAEAVQAALRQAGFHADARDQADDLADIFPEMGQGLAEWIITAPDGHVIDHPDPVALCRCGGSSNKPFCDGTHATIDFDGTLAN